VRSKICCAPPADVAFGRVGCANSRSFEGACLAAASPLGAALAASRRDGAVAAGAVVSEAGCVGAASFAGG
jgi:hypothetical protein